MNAKQAENLLAALYPGSVVLSLVSIVSLVVPWQHWRITLNGCIKVDCGCIMYAVNTFGTFFGGAETLCHFTIYALIPAILCGLCLGIYHGYRSCIHKGLGHPRTIPRDMANDGRNMINGDIVVVSRKQRSACKQWMLAAFLAALVTFLSLAHAVVLTDGYYKTCDHYRRHLVGLLGSRGSEIKVIHNRLACGAVFDFMDYLQPDINDWRRGDEINTGLALQLSIVSTWLNFISWILIFTINFIMARRRNNILSQKMCCCC